MRRGVRRPLVALVALVLALVVGYLVKGLGSDGPKHPDPSGTTSTTSSTPPGSTASGARGDGAALTSLPVQAAQTVRLIGRGGPFPYPRSDGGVFHNNEHDLPKERDGFYREYTVPTPGSDDRGERRIIRGADGQLYYTGDHYATFRLVDVTR